MSRLKIEEIAQDIGLAGIGLQFAVRFRETIATQLEVTLHAPNGSATFIKQPRHGYQSVYIRDPDRMLLAVPDTRVHESAMLGFPAPLWRFASPDFVAALACLIPECAGSRIYWLMGGKRTLDFLSKCTELTAERLASQCGAGFVWPVGHEVEPDDVATLVAEPPDWAYFDEPPCK
jgi:hypothetical protein